MTTPPEQVRPRRAPDVRVVETSADELVVTAGDRTRIVLNGTARALWELCDGVTTVEEMAGAVNAVFDTDADTARTEVSSGLRDLHEAGLITW